MNLSPVFLMKFKNTIERILHVKGNYNGGILEMAVVIDHNLSKESVQDIMPQLLRTLKMHSEIFRNVRLNVVEWNSDEVITSQVSPMSVAGMSGYYDSYVQQKQKKDFMKLISYLKLFQARAKVIILLTDASCDDLTQDGVKAAMQPFLDKKLMQVALLGENLEVRYRFVTN